MAPAPRPAAPAPGPSEAFRDARVPVRRRMALVRADDRSEEIPIAETHFVGTSRRVDEDHPAAVDAMPGYGVTVRTEDARAAFPILFARVPDPAPGVLVFRVPSVDHPRLASLILEFTDAGTGAPIPGARIEWEPDSPVQTPTTADGSGRAMLDVPESKDERAALLTGLAGSLLCVHARGYRTACLSNTNATHWQQMSDPAAPCCLPLERLSYQFGSHLIGARKPDRAVYEHVERVTTASGRQVVFFDDLPENVSAAQLRGWRAHQVLTDRDPIVQVREHLSRHRVL